AKILGAIVAENQKAAHAASKKATGEAIKGVDYWDELATKRVASLVRRNTIGLGMLALAKLYVELEEEGKVPSIATYNNETGRFQFVNVASPVLSRLVGKQTADVLVPLPLDQLGGPFSLFAFAYSQWKVARNPELTEAMRKNRLYGDAMAFMFSNPMLQGVETWLSIALGKGVSKDWGYVSARLGRAIGTTVFPGITRAWEIAYDRANNFGQRYATNFLEGMIAPTIFGRNLAISASGKVFPNLPKQYQVEFVKAGYEPSLPPSTEDKEELLRWMSDLASTEAYGPLRPASVVVTPEDHARWTHLFTKYGALYAIKTIESQPYKNSPTKLPARIKVAGG
ncbi:MAG: hypothetical protein N2109_13580, partial [Fimbriimonadales bacterium]|nr:hypothetical protein [Fimbriimonadales bacterium]